MREDRLWAAISRLKRTLEKTKAEIQELESGERTRLGAGPPPYGYKVVIPGNPKEGTKQVLDIEPKEQAVIKYVTEMRTKGYKYALIVKALNDAGYRTRRGGLWTIQKARHNFENRG